MALQIQDSRILIKRSSNTSEVPETAPSNDHTDGTWNTLDIYVGELFCNVEDRKLWLRYTDSIDQILTVPIMQSGIHTYANASGTDTYTATLTPTLEAYTTGNVFAVKFANANTGAATINIDSLGAKSLKLSGSALSASAITANVVYLIAYNGTNFDIIGGGSTSVVNSGTQYRLAYYATTGTAVSQANAITANRALVSDANGVPTHATTTATEIGYVNGVTSAIQTQLDARLPLAGGTMSGAINEYKGADIASAATTDIGAATGNYVDITGTTTITALGTIQAGTRRIVRFTGALTLTHNATSLILPTGANITTTAGDTAEFVSLGSGNWRCVQYTTVNNNNIYDVQTDTGTTYTLSNSDFPIRNIRWIRHDNASAITITIPQDSTLTAAPVGATIVFHQKGAGQITIAAGAGNAIYGADSAFTSRTQYSVVSATKTAANTWLIYGDTL